MVLNMHGGTGSPDIGMFPASPAMFVLEASFYAHRPLWALVMSGVFDRFPGLQLVFAEAGSSWVANTLAAMDSIQARIEQGNVGVMPVANPLDPRSMKPSEYWRRNCWLGSSFMTRGDADDRDAVGSRPDHVGQRLPPRRGHLPAHPGVARAHVRGIDPAEVAAMVGGTAAHVYGFDLDALRPVADRIGPEVAAVRAGLDRIPTDTTSFAFGPRTVGVA